MSSIFDTFTKSGSLLQDGYNRLTAVDYDPTCEMVDVINEYDDLPRLELEVEQAKDSAERAERVYRELRDEFEKRYPELEARIATAEVTELKEEIE